MKPSSIKVLLIEDNPGDARLIQEALKESGDSFFEVSLEPTLGAGLSHLLESLPDVILLDLMLPDSSGEVTFKEIHARAEQLPILVLTGLRDQAQALAAVREGAQDYIAKGEMTGALLANSIRYAIERKRVEQMLRESEQRYREVFDGVKDAIFIETPNGRILDANLSACETYGYTREQFLTKTVADLVPSKEYLVAVEPADPSAPPIHPVETVNVRANGEQFPMELSIRQQTSRGEPVLYVVGRDITERKRAEQALAQERYLMRILMDHVPDYIYFKDLQGRFLQVSMSHAKSFGLSDPREAEGKSDFDFFSEEHARQACDDERKILDTGESILNIEERETRTGLPDAWVLTSKMPLRDQAGKIIGTFGVSRDITERKQAEERFRAVTEGSLAGVYILQDDKFRYVNPAVAGFLGYTVEEIVDHLGPLDLVHPDDRSLVADNVRRRIDGEVDSVHYTSRFVRRDGRLLHLEILGRRWTFRGRSAIIGTVLDVTDRKLAEEELNKVNRALRTLSGTNQTLVRARSEQALLDEVCRIVVESGGYRLAWVAMAEQDEQKTIRAVAQAGYEEGYLGWINITWADTEQGRGPTGTAIRTGKMVIAQDIHTDPNYALWREEALKRGYSSSIALPFLGEKGKAFGSLNIYATEPDAFKPEEVNLLSELASNLAFGIEAIRSRQAQHQAEAQLERQLVHLESLRTIETAIASSLDLRTTLSVFLDQVTTQLKVDAADVLLYNPHSQTLEYAEARGFRTGALKHTHLRLGEGYAGRAASERSAVRIPAFNRVPFGLEHATLLPAEGFAAYYAMPLVAKGTVKGVLEIFHRSALDPDREWEEYLETLASEAALAIDNAGLFSELQRSNLDLTLAYDATIEGWSRAMDLRDKETEGHTQRVTEMTERLAMALGIAGENLLHVRRGALLHDIGKMGVPDGILLKPGPLTEEEWVVMRKHPDLAHEMLWPIDYLRPALDIPYSHHEKWDGTGYPRGLKGEEIPLAARAFAVVDVWDALRSDRPYRSGWPEEKVIAHIREQAGKHFEPRVVETFLRLLKETR